MANCRMRLRELANVTGARYVADLIPVNDGLQPRFMAVVRVCDANEREIYKGESDAKLSKPEAEEAAAQDAWDKAGLGDPAEYSKAAVRRQAWLGDAAQDFVLGLLGTRAGLTAAQMDDLSQSLLCNKALAEDAPEQLASDTLTATHVEARLGLRLAQNLDSLLEILLKALIDANPALHDKLQAGVAAVAA